MKGVGFAPALVSARGRLVCLSHSFWGVQLSSQTLKPRFSKMFWHSNDFEDLAQSVQPKAFSLYWREKTFFLQGMKKNTLCLLHSSEQTKCCLLQQKRGRRQGWAGHRGGAGGAGCQGKVTDLIALAARPQPSSDTYKRILSSLNTLPAASVQITRINGLKLNLCSCKRAV